MHSNVSALLDDMEGRIRWQGSCREAAHYDYPDMSVLVLMVWYGRMEWVTGYKTNRARFIVER